MTAPVEELEAEMSDVAVDVASVVGNVVSPVDRGVVRVLPRVSGKAEVEGRGLLVAEVTPVAVLGGEGVDVPAVGTAVCVVEELSRAVVVSVLRGAVGLSVVRVRVDFAVEVALAVVKVV